MYSLKSKKNQLYFIDFSLCKRSIIVCFLLLVNLNNSNAATITTGGSGNWNSTTNNAPWPGGTIPATGDSIIVASGHNLTVNGNRTCAGIRILGTVTISNGITLTVNGGVGGSGTISSGNNRIITTTGNWTFNGTNTSNHTVTFNGTADQTITGVLGGATTILIINKASGAAILGANRTVGTFTNTAGTFDPATFLLTAGTRTFTAGTLRVGATTWSGNYSGTITQPPAGVIEYNASGNQTINNVAYPGHLTTSGSGTKTLAGNLSVTGDITIGSGTTLDESASNFTIGCAGNWTNNGTFAVRSGAVTFTGATKTISGTSTTVFPVVTIANNASYTMNNNNSCSGLILATGANATTFTHGTDDTLTVTGNVTINQPSSAATKAWNINAGDAVVTGNVTIGSNIATTNCISSLAITTGSLSVTGNITCSTTVAANAVLNMNTSGATVNLGGALTFTSLGTFTANAASNFNYNGTTAQTVNMSVNYGNLLLNNTFTSGATLGAAISVTNVTGNVSVNSGLFNNGGFAIVGNSGKAFTVANGATFTLGGTTSVTFPTGFTTTTLGATSTVNYASSANQTVAAHNYGHLTVTLNGTRTVTLASAGTVGIAGTYTPASGTTSYTTTSSTVNFNGSTQNIPAFTFNNLTVSGGGVKTLTGNVTVNAACSLTLGKISIGANTLTLNSSLVSDPTNCFTANGSSSISIGGSGALGSNLYLDQSSRGTTNRLADLTYNRNNITITLGDTVEVTGAITPTAGTLATADKLKLISNASGTARVMAGTGSYITGNVTAERFIPSSARRWRFGGATVSGRTMADLQDDIFITGPGGATNGFDVTLTNYAGVYSYNESVTTGDINSGWVACGNITDSITVGKGFRIFVRGDRDPGRLDGSINTQNAVTLDLVGSLNNGDISIPVTYTSSGSASNDGWNLVANPYACQIDWNMLHDAGRTGIDSNFSGTDFAHIKQTVYSFDATTNSYTSYNALSNTGTGNLSNGIIPAGAAFWVQAVAASPSLTIKEVYKTNNTPAAIFKTAAERFTIKLVQDSITSDEAIIRYMPQASDVFDVYDISKMYGSDVNIASIGKDGSFLSANCKPFNVVSDTIPLSLGFANSGSYKMEFNNPGGIGLEVNKAMFLVDLYAKQVKDLNATDEYTFTVDKNNTSTFGNDRFKLIVGDLPTSIPEEISGNDAAGLYLYPSVTNDRTTIFGVKTIGENAGVIVTDIGGRIIETISETYWSNNQLTLDLSHYHTGLYFISITRKSQTIQTLKCIKE